MGMRISSNTGAGCSGAAAWQQRQQDFKALARALQAGDLSTAKTAYTALAGSGRPAASSTSPLAQLGQALQAGDLAGAQKAMASMRGHHRAAPAAAPVSTTPPANSTGGLHLTA